jgi:carbamoyltransferase
LKDRRIPASFQPVATILGISAYYHDSAAALVRDGIIIAAAQEERFTRVKHDHCFPSKSIACSLEQAGITAADLDYVAFYDKPLLKFDRLLETYLAYAPSGFRSFSKAMPLWIHQKLHLAKEIRRELGGAYRKRIIFPEHHESHAASAFFPSPFDSAAIVTMDGVGEWTTTSMGTGTGNRIEITREIRFPHSLGLLYSAFTYYCGFKVNGGEYKLMGLAPYGEPKYASLIRDHLIDLREDGSFRLNMAYFNYCQGLTMTNGRFSRLFGGPPRQPESELTQRDMDIAASIQTVTEEAMLRICRSARQETGMRNLCLAGGVALNCVGNGRILREAGFENVWIQPASGDAGGALGAALFTSHQLLETPRQPSAPDSQHGSLLGHSHSDEEIRATLDKLGAIYRHEPVQETLLNEAVSHLAQGRVVGWFQGRMEFGPRALGSRSILGDPRDRGMQSRMNLKIKFRESFRPFAAAVLREDAADYFEIGRDQESPYMLLVTKVREDKRLPADTPASGIDKLQQPRSVIPAVTHVDHSCRIQTVDAVRNPRLHHLLEMFKASTGCPMLVNTSFNVRGEPIVCTPADAYRCFLETDMDAMVIGNFLLLKEAQPSATGTPLPRKTFAPD